MKERFFEPELPDTSVESFIRSSSQLSKSWSIAETRHQGQMRAEGLPYFSHCVEVARVIYEEWGIKDETILSAALLHDTVEDTDLTLKEIEAEFDSETASLVDGVSKFKSEKMDKKLRDRETLRKVFDRNLIDPRVAVLKLADRVHNMRTLDALPPEKQCAKAEETLNVYSKLAESLGMWVVMKELEDLSLKYTSPSEYRRLGEIVEADPRTSDLFVYHTISSLESAIRQNGVDASVIMRKNSLWRLRHKSEKTPRFEDINDVVSFRVVVNDGFDAGKTRDDCYKLLGVLRENYSHDELTDRFSDYYSNPSDNGYSAIQMTVGTPQGAIEIAITSGEKEEFNNWGIVSQLKKGNKELSDYALKLVFTPSGQVKFFPKNASGVDFAYSISRKLGEQSTSVLVDDREFPLSYVIPNGSIVEVVVGEPKNTTDVRLLDYCLPSTKKILEEQIADHVRVEQVARGRAMISEVLAHNCGLIDLGDLMSFEEHKLKLTNLLHHLGCKGSLDTLYYLTGSGLLSTEYIGEQLNKGGFDKKTLGLTTISLVGKDKPGILENVGRTIEKAGGNIGALDYQRKKDNGEALFMLRLVVENLDTDTENKLGESFRNNYQMSRIKIV